MKMLTARKAIVNAVVAVGAVYAGAVVKLYQNVVVPTPRTPLLDLTEATFPGYAASAAIVWTPAGQNVNDEAVSYSDQKLFTATGPTPANVIYGYYLISTGGALLEIVPFVQPVPVIQAGDIVAVVHILTEPQD